MFTLWPILFLGCFDRDVTLKDTERFPGLYVLGINDVFFNAKARRKSIFGSRQGLVWPYFTSFSIGGRSVKAVKPCGLLLIA